jgi:hypothetical protein
MKYGELTLGQIEALVNKLGGMEVVRNILADKVEVVAKTVSYITGTFKCVVNKTVKIETEIKAAGFDWSNDGINTKNFPKPEGGDVSDKDIILFWFKGIGSYEAIAKMAEEGCRPADVWELTALAKAQPDLQREYPIIALGSVCKLDGSRRVPCLYGNSGHRELYLYSYGHDWDDRCRFAAVRK